MDNLTELKRLLKFAFGVEPQGETVAEVLNYTANALEAKQGKKTSKKGDK